MEDRKWHLVLLRIWTILACWKIRPSLSEPDDLVTTKTTKPIQYDFDNWYVLGKKKEENSRFPPPGLKGSSATKKLPKCTFDNVFAVDEGKKVILLTETMMVDNCLLECGNKIIESTVRDQPIVTVRNGGHVKNCRIVLVKNHEVNNVLEDLDIVEEDEDEEESEEGTLQPTVVLTEIVTGEEEGLVSASTVAVKVEVMDMKTQNLGFLCDRGDCVLENVFCEADPDDTGYNHLMFKECVSVQTGASTVTVQGGLVTSTDLPVSFYGIVVDAGPKDNDDAVGGFFQEEYDGHKVRLLVKDVRIENQVYDGIKILGGANMVRIQNSVVSNNVRDGIDLSGAIGLEVIAILGGIIHKNGRHGIDVFEHERAFDGNSVVPTKLEMMVADVSLAENQGNGLFAERIHALAIHNAIIDSNGWNGIDVREADTIRVENIVSKFNVLNGLAVEAIDADLEIANSIFLTNGVILEGPLPPNHQRAGVYVWRTKSLKMVNSISKSNGVDGILVFDVSSLSLSDVDSDENGRDGIHIRESSAAYGYDYTSNSDYLVGAYYYPWHGENFHNNGGYLRKELDPPQGPSLGEYNDSDPDIIEQHMEWFRKANIGLLVTSWWGPDRIEDTNTRNVLMKHDHIGNLKIALHYETTGRIKDGDNMSVPKSDIRFLCKNYFDHPNYYKIDGRPVLVIYISRKLEQLGTLEKALLTMKSEANKCGHNLYLIGDAVFAKAPEVNDEEPFVSFTYFDAVTNYDVYGSSGASKSSTPYAGKQGVDDYYREQEKWRNLAIAENCRYIPPVSPGYNDRAVRLEKDNPPLSRRLTESSREGSLFEYQLEKALPLVDPKIDNLILVNSFNEWHEDTQIEPAVGLDANSESSQEPENLTGGLEYVGYGEGYLDILRRKTSKKASATGTSKDVYQPSNVAMTNVQTCQNGQDGITFFINDNNLEETTPELSFTPGSDVVSCGNEAYDFQMNGGGGLDFVGEEILIGNTCANGPKNDDCSNDMNLQTCPNNVCKQRDVLSNILTFS